MNRDELRALQAPLKQRYRDQPAAALVDATLAQLMQAIGLKKQ
jgi:hypothetical protein